MELMYPIVIVVCLILAMIVYFMKFDKKIKYSQGKKIANTKYIKETEYYKAKVRKYKLITNTIKVLSVLCIGITGVLIARPVTVENRSQDKYNRDIIIGLDISTSECEVNLELIREFKEIIPSIKGDRIGIVTYNTAPVVYCPLTEDYDYINECLDKIEKQMDLVVKNNGEVPYISTDDEEGIESYAFWNGGAIANSEIKGSSLVGDGLARNDIFFSRFEERQR